MRRSRREVELGRLLRIGQDWAKCGDLIVWRVRQVHRLDCMVELIADAHHVVRISFGELLRNWEPADHEIEEALAA